MGSIDKESRGGTGPHFRGKLAAAILLAALFFSLPGSPCRTKTRTGNKKSPYGINAHIPSTRQFDQIEKLGMGWVRVDFTWDFVQPKRNKLRWDKVDRVVEDAEKRGLHILAILGYCPPWASSGPDHTYPPKDPQEWKSFVRAMVSRYKGRIRHWTLWNEPNNKTFFKGNVDQYISNVLVPGWEAAKGVDPDCRIVGPDLAHLGSANWDDWLDTVIHYAGNRFDIIGHHCYQKNPGRLFKELDGRKAKFRGKTVYEILAKHGHQGKPFWLTETGWRVQKVGEGKQADYLVDVLQGVNKDPWIKKVFLFHLPESDFDPGYGMLHKDDSPRASFRAVQGYIKTHPPPNRNTGARSW